MAPPTKVRTVPGVANSTAAHLDNAVTARSSNNSLTNNRRSEG